VIKPRLARIPGVSLSSLSCPSGRTDTEEPTVRIHTETYADTRGLARALANELPGSPEHQH